MVRSVDLQTEYIWHHTHTTPVMLCQNIWKQICTLFVFSLHSEVQCLYDGRDRLNFVADWMLLLLLLSGLSHFSLSLGAANVNIIETFTILHFHFNFSTPQFRQPICSNQTRCMISIFVRIKAIYSLSIRLYKQ